ncbi:response regulator transcription factor [Chelatococcus sambhunathii]|uniref:Response regulator transcription factor n=1 Tax=Chelatococcus sambhunathii TaxID=363953 RepID=A0ABU1DB91_9HYPH|nr:response regulator transcription factor [Chelatococcus sambhunathii]MDR4305385.1 response regulator transcription factor [Chelatococcus sambhunathii]
MRILVVEDDAILLDGLRVGLELAGLTIDAVSTCADAAVALSTSAFDAVVLDRMLPDGSGLDVLRRVRRSGDRTPIILLTALNETANRIEGLDAGGDDYLGKPFDLEELAARLRSIARRGAGRASATMEWRDLVVDPAARLVLLRGDRVDVSRREFAILTALMERPGTIRSRADLEERLYGWDGEVESNAVEVHIHHLRAKLGRRTIETVRGLGYRIGGER